MSLPKLEDRKNTSEDLNRLRSFIKQHAKDERRLLRKKNKKKHFSFFPPVSHNTKKVKPESETVVEPTGLPNLPKRDVLENFFHDLDTVDNVSEEELDVPLTKDLTSSLLSLNWKHGSSPPHRKKFLKTENVVQDGTTKQRFKKTGTQEHDGVLQVPYISVSHTDISDDEHNDKGRSNIVQGMRHVRRTKIRRRPKIHDPKIENEEKRIHYLLTDDEIKDRRSSYIALFRKPRTHMPNKKDCSNPRVPNSNSVFSSITSKNPYKCVLNAASWTEQGYTSDVLPRHRGPSSKNTISKSRGLPRSHSEQAVRGKVSRIGSRRRTTSCPPPNRNNTKSNSVREVVTYQRMKSLYQKGIANLRHQRQETFYEKLETLQLEEAIKFNENLKEKQLKRRETKAKQQRQLYEIEKKFEEDRAKRWRKQYVNSKNFYEGSVSDPDKSKRKEFKLKRKKQTPIYNFDETEIRQKNIKMFGKLFDVPLGARWDAGAKSPTLILA